MHRGQFDERALHDCTQVGIVTCSTCMLLCDLLSFFSQYEVTEHGRVSGVQNMMAEIYARGPIACTVAVTADFENYKGGIFSDSTGAKVTIVIVQRSNKITSYVIN